MREIWSSDAFVLTDTPRSRALRNQLVTRLLAQLMTDDERAKLNGLPEGCRMRENAKIIEPDRLNCGSFVWIGEGAIIDASGGMSIGDHTTVGSGSYLWSHSSAASNLLMDNRPGNPHIRRKPTRIGHGTFIGGPSVVYSGVTIGSRCVVMPMSVVTRDVPDMTMVGGSPARTIRSIDESYLKRLRSSGEPGNSQ